MKMKIPFFTRRLPIVVALLFSTCFVTFMPHFGNLLYILYGIILVYSLKHCPFKINKFNFIFIAICFCSLVINDVPSYYRPWMRLLLFCTVIFFVGPFIESRYLRAMRICVFWCIQWLFLGISILSFLGKFLGFNMIYYGNYIGFTGHSPILGYVSGLSVLFLLFLYFNYKDIVSQNKKLQKCFFLTIFATTLTLMLAASRSAFVACLFGVACFYFLLYKDHRKKVIKIFLYAIAILLVTFPIWGSYADKLIEKNHGKIVEIDMSSRQSLWDDAMEKIERNFFTGVGFSCVTDDISMTGANGFGGIEIGNSYLTILLMLGCVGFIFFCCICFVVIHSTCYLWIFDNTLFSYFLAFLLFHLVHMMGEGYVMSGGSMLFFVFWLTLGCLQAYARDRKEIMTFTPINFVLPDGY